MKKRIAYIITLFLSIVFINSQEAWENDNFHSIKLENTDYYKIDSLQVIEGSIELYDESRHLIRDYQWDESTQEITLANPTNFTLEYYTYPKKFSKNWSAKDSSLIVSRSDQIKLYDYSKGLATERNSIFEDIIAEGSLVRGLSFGNNQGAAVQSSLNLNLEGKLSEKLNIIGHLSDYNIPIEQDGYSQQINEFENIYLGITSENSGLYAGFLSLNPQDTYFANYNKRVTGVQLNTTFHYNNDATTTVSATGSVTRGEYYRSRFIALEGNQGPYQLKGKNNETFIVIVPRSERIYLDGILLESGPQNDYTINYNTGEITFTENRLLSQNQRITAEYQYTSLSYTRFLWAGSADYKNNKFLIRASLYSENDAKNSPTQQNLDDEDIEILQNAGNNISDMLAPSYTISEFAENKILYKRTTTINGIEFFEYSTDPNEVLYAVGFTYLGPNQGDYVKEENTTNGRVFKYIEPINGVPQGTHLPVKRLIAPESRQVFSLDTAYQLKEGKIELNAAYSNDDQNTFSSIGDQDNGGYAFHAKMNKNFNLNQWKITPQVEYSFISPDFYIIDRINKVEFYRDFEIEKEFDQIQQQQLNFQLGTQFKELQLNYKIDFLNRMQNYNGSTQFINMSYAPNAYLFQVDVLLNNNTFQSQNNSINQVQAKAKRTFEQIILEIGANTRAQDQFEQNLQGREKQDYQKYNILGTYLPKDSLKFRINSELYTTKADTLNTIQNSKSTAYGGNLSSYWKPYKNTEFVTSLHLRTVDNRFEMQNLIQQENNLLTDLLWNQNIWKESMRFSTQYVLATGNTPEREFQYVEVSDGNGIYKWTDYNNNGIQEIDEFEIAEFQDLARYVRVYTSTISYLKTAKNALKFNFSFQPSKIWNTVAAKRWRFNSSFLTESTFPKDEEIAVFNPFQSEGLLYNNKNIISEIRYNNLTKNKWEASYKYLLINNFRNNYLGKESLDKWSQQARVNIKIIDNLIWENLGDVTHIKSFSQNLLGKNYFIKSFKLLPSLTYNYLNQWKFSVFYQFQNKENQYQGQELKTNNLGANLEYLKGKTSLLSRFSYVINNFNGDSFSLVANQMLEGLKPGKNLVWSINLQRELASFIYLDINYEGRKNEDSKAIHIGNVQVKFTF